MKTQHVLGIVQARMGSTRLPGKVLMPLAGRSVLGWVTRAVFESDVVDDLVVATTTEPNDDQVADECRRLGVDVVRGPVDDVLTRFTLAMRGRDCGAVARFTADCPLLDPSIIAAAVTAWRAAPWLDYVSTAMPRSVPRGMDVEVAAARTLLGLSQRQLATHHRTHVTSAIYTAGATPGWEQRMLGLAFAPSASDLRVTLDTPDDWRLIQTVVEKFGDRPASLPELVDFLRTHPDVVALNGHIDQKPLESG